MFSGIVTAWTEDPNVKIIVRNLTTNLNARDANGYSNLRFFGGADPKKIGFGT